MAELRPVSDSLRITFQHVGKSFFALERVDCFDGSFGQHLSPLGDDFVALEDGAVAAAASGAFAGDVRTGAGQSKDEGWQGGTADFDSEDKA